MKVRSQAVPNTLMQLSMIRELFYEKKPVRQAFGRAGNFPFLAIFSPNREPVHRLTKKDFWEKSNFADRATPAKLAKWFHPQDSTNELVSQDMDC